jgi:general secretion pathway protein G
MIGNWLIRPDGTKCPIWDSFLTRVVPDSEKREFLQRFVGSALTGDTADERLPVLFGTGANGKSTTSQVLKRVLGDYALTAAPNLLIQQKYDSHPTEVADLRGSRLVFSVEIGDNRNMDEAKVKQAKTDLHTLENCLDLYKIDKGRYPSTEEGLQAVVTAGKCKNQLKDPWGHPYVYLFPGQAHPDSFDLKSYGADGQQGGESTNADIINP